MPSWTRDELRPRHSSYLHKRTLFPVTLEKFEVETQVSADEMRRWHQAGWLSFDPTDLTQIDWGEDAEVRFIRALARSGLGDKWINDLLATLEKPYCYDPATTFYSFTNRIWITLPVKPEFSFDEEIAALAESEDWESLQEIRDRIDELLPDDSE
ncbi:MAG: hypothetical protein JXQ75_09490 [Phycisphaerae bacterium]|nr:hypothetical protein [Phycisphaerae bacterium]